jgi:hypothetical protein
MLCAHKVAVGWEKGLTIKELVSIYNIQALVKNKKAQKSGLMPLINEMVNGSKRKSDGKKPGQMTRKRVKKR